MNSPPFSIATATPASTDNLSSYPAAETGFREMIVSALAREHDFLDALQNFSGHHKFGVGSSASRDAITDWVVGSIWFNTDATATQLQRVVSVGPVVWESVGATAGSTDALLQDRVFNRSF